MKALYHQISGSVELEVIGKPKDGKADLGKDKVVMVGGCLISKEPALGTCTLIKDEIDADLKAAAKAARLKATQLSKAATEAAKAADAAKGKDDHEALVKAASEASEAAKVADTEADAAEEAAK